MVEILLKRDVFEKRRRHELLVGPEMMQNHLTLERYDATEDVLRMTRKQLSHPNCIVDRVTLTSVTFNDTKARLFAEGITRNDTIREVDIINCKIRGVHMEIVSKAIGANESIEYIQFNKCNFG